VFNECSTTFDIPEWCHTKNNICRVGSYRDGDYEEFSRLGLAACSAVNVKKNFGGIYLLNLQGLREGRAKKKRKE
jgi:hypothetical protein